MKILAIIPARYQSTRFPGKPLAMIKGKSMINRVFEQTSKAKSIDRVVVATDDQRIYDHVKEFNGDAVFTGTHHQNGTSRCYETAEILEAAGYRYDAVINVQGDEPTVRPEQIEMICSLLRKPEIKIATLIKKIDQSETLFNPNVVKVVIGKNGQAIYFSRHPIPLVRDFEPNEWINHHQYFKHIGLYGFKRDSLIRIMQLLPGKLELAERLEQLRWLENGLSIYTQTTDFETIGIDTPEDLENLLTIID